MIAASIIELTARPAVVSTAATVPVTVSSTPLFGDLLRQALKASGEGTPAAGTVSKAVRRPQPDTESETTPGAIANLLAAAPPQATVILPTPIPQQQTLALPTVPAIQPASASPAIDTAQVPPFLSSVEAPIQTLQQSLAPNDITVPPPSAIVTKPDVIANTSSPAAAPDVPVHTSVASKVEHWIQNTVLSAVPVSIQNLNPLATLHAVVKELTGAAADPTQNSLPKSDASVPATADPVPPVPVDLNSAPQQQTAVTTPPSISDPSTGPVTASQLATVLQSNQTLPVTSLSAKSSVTAKALPVVAASIKDGGAPLNGAKQPSLSYTQKTDPQYSPKEQDQAGHVTPGSSATAVPANQADPPAVILNHSSSVATATLAPPSPPLTPANEQTRNSPDLPAPVVAPHTEALPDINTAKVIQSVGQSEMRVGMRSTEFGNISISTSASRDVISAQISLDHTELARTLAVHLPEMQARLSGGQPMDVRIEMQGQATSQTHGSSTGMANSSADNARDEHSQRGHGTHAHSAEARAERPSFTNAAALAAGDIRLNERLDITA